MSHNACGFAGLDINNLLNESEAVAENIVVKEFKSNLHTWFYLNAHP